jgi:hypothetical protein
MVIVDDEQGDLLLLGPSANTRDNRVAYPVTSRERVSRYGKLHAYPLEIDI